MYARFPLICLTALPLFLFTVAAGAEETKVMVNHAPQSFGLVLEKLDSENRIQLPSDDWFELDDADVWVFFLNPENDLHAVPDMVRKVYTEIDGVARDVARVSVGLGEGREIDLQIVDLSKEPKNGVSLKGCISALDVISVAYPDFDASTEAVERNCKEFETD